MFPSLRKMSQAFLLHMLVGVVGGVIFIAVSAVACQTFITSLDC